ncbi:hypothetical protein DPMN_090092 [Dreissena polymorpha]|uniref:Uncharacterized protein n=1 Tax=Dreissena polymorpha TaxID=45954 RepID=A0A9D4KXJ6_DREPO|nr:hypothetical protein DPMN_090092 [Dreissena polymorpha]
MKFQSCRRKRFDIRANLAVLMRTLDYLSKDCWFDPLPDHVSCVGIGNETLSTTIILPLLQDRQMPFAHLRGAKNVTSRVEKCPAHWRPYINKTNVLTNFHDDWAKIVTSRVHVIELTRTIFELYSQIKETKVLTKCHENWAKNVTSKVSSTVEKHGHQWAGQETLLTL